MDAFKTALERLEKTCDLSLEQDHFDSSPVHSTPFSHDAFKRSLRASIATKSVSFNCITYA
jgi:hypothetical protein